MTQVSTNLTLFYRLFIPVFFGVFLGALVIFLWTHPQAYYGRLQGTYLRVGLTFFYFMFLLTIAFTSWRLRRVEVSREWVYITDFFRQARYPWSNISAVKESSYGIFQVVKISFYEPGTFGKTATFVASRSKWRIFKEVESERLAELLKV